MSNSNNVNIGNSGEYFVAGELERRGFTVALPLSNVKDFDILAINRENYEQFAIQVKTTGYKQKKWTLSVKNEELVGEHIIYVFVSLNELAEPEYHVVPSKIVAETIKKEHQEWLSTPGKKGQQRNDTNIRKFSDSNDTYLNRWKYLNYEYLQSVLGENRYKVLTDYIPKLQNIEYGKVYPEKQTGDGSLENPFTMPYMVYADVVNDFVHEFYYFEEQHPEYGLNRYSNILQDNHIEWNEDAMISVDISQQDGKVVLALILGAIRAERFCSGALKSFLEKGCIQKWLERLKELDEMVEK